MTTFQYKYNDLQRKWLDDLKTTTEPQAQLHLQVLPFVDGVIMDPGGYCCLGRACVVAGLKGVSHDLRYVDFGQGISEELPPDLADKLRLKTTAGLFKVGYKDPDKDIKYYHLTGMNDDGGFSFKQIAEYIEANPDNVFSDYEEQKRAWAKKVWDAEHSPEMDGMS